MPSRGILTFTGLCDLHFGAECVEIPCFYPGGGWWRVVSCSMLAFLAKTRDLIIIIGIFTYFTAFVYVHFYYEAFGLSTQSLKIDYASYLVYAYDVVSAPLFIICAGTLIALLVFGKMGLRYVFLKKRLGLGRKLVRYRFAWRVFELVLLFPFLYYTSRAVAREDYVAARIDLKDLKAIQFVFRNSADGLGPAVRLDSLPLATNQLVGDMRLLKQDSSERLNLLGETDEAYIVLNQPPYDPALHQLPSGYIYYVNKNDVLLARISLRSQTIK